MRNPNWVNLDNVVPSIPPKILNGEYRRDRKPIIYTGYRIIESQKLYKSRHTRFKPTQQEIKTMVEEIEEKRDPMTKGEFLSMMTDYASLYRENGKENIEMNKHLHDLNDEQIDKIEVSEIEAILADFICWVGYNWGVDYALRACDLSSHATKVKGLMVINRIGDDAERTRIK